MGALASFCAAGAHPVTRSRSAASRAGPMPGTASSSSTEPKPPCSWRYCRIFAAVPGPMPSSWSSLLGRGAVEVDGGARRAGRARFPHPPPSRPAAAPRAGTSTWRPSVSRAARLSESRSRVAAGAARPAHRRGHPRAGRQPVHPRPPHRARHVDHEPAAPAPPPPSTFTDDHRRPRPAPPRRSNRGRPRRAPTEPRAPRRRSPPRGTR